MLRYCDGRVLGLVSGCLSFISVLYRNMNASGEFTEVTEHLVCFIILFLALVVHCE